MRPGEQVIQPRRRGMRPLPWESSAKGVEVSLVAQLMPPFSIKVPYPDRKEYHPGQGLIANRPL